MEKMGFCERVRRECDGIWEASFRHPFVEALAGGTLDEDIFRFYVLQDAYYLSHFAKVQALGAVKAKDLLTTQSFAGHAEATCSAELALHEEFFTMLGVTPEEHAEFRPAPTTYAYTSHMYRAAVEGDLADVLAALLPCYWLYWEIGERLKGAEPGHPIYDKWIATYGSEWFGGLVNEQIERMNRLAEGLPEERILELAERFRKSSIYELNFWGMAWTKEQWETPEMEGVR